MIRLVEMGRHGWKTAILTPCAPSFNKSAVSVLREETQTDP